MIHKNHDEFVQVLMQTSAQTGFPLLLLEKDYYITLILSEINMLSEGLIFKGATCLSKVYYSYYRLSEDIDFSFLLPVGKINRSTRRSLIEPLKKGIHSYAKQFDMEISKGSGVGHNESTQYLFNLDYQSVVLDKKQSIKMEVGLRFNPILPFQKRAANHKFVHPFTGKPLFECSKIKCFALKELVAEKMRAAATRRIIAPRDFYDIGFLIKSGFNFRDKELHALFKRKLAEDGFDSDARKYRINIGRSDEEIHDMKSRIEAELLDVLLSEEKNLFNLQNTLKAIDESLKDLE